MKLTSIALPALTFLSTTTVLAQSPAVPWERLDKNNTVVIVLDLQVGLFNLVRDFDPTLYYHSMLAHASLGQLFDLPVILSTSAQTGPNGPLPKEILRMYPTAPLIQRNGEVDAWDNPDFRRAVEATGKKQVVLAGIVTDVCTAFCALSLRAAGYSVWANVEASGTTSPLVRDAANVQMTGAGVNVVSLFAIVCDLMRDWRNAPGAATVIPWIDLYLPAYSLVARGHGEAIRHGVLIPGEAEILS